MSPLQHPGADMPKPTPPPARCGSSAVHPPHPIDGSAPGVADCEGQPRRATDREIAQARAYAADVVATRADVGPNVAAFEQRVYESALAVLIHANGGRYTEPIDWDKVLRERDSLARRCAARFEEAEELRRRIAVLEASPRAWAPSQGQDIPDDHLDALDHAIREGVDDVYEAARRELKNAYRVGYAAALGYEITIADGRVGVGDRPEPALPVTPAADLADEAAHERVADALDAALRAVGLLDASREAARRSVAYNLAKAAVDAYRAGQPIDMDGTLAVLQREALAAARNLEAGLYERGLLDTLPSDRAAGELVRMAFAHLDRLTTALDEAARDAHETVELQAVYDDGLSTDQEIRARALDSAIGLADTSDAGDLTRWALDTASEFAAFIGDGVSRYDIEAPDYDEAWEGSSQQRAYAQGYAEAARRLRDAPMAEASREGFATYLDGLAPDPDDPWAVDAPGKGLGATPPVFDEAPSLGDSVLAWIDHVAPDVKLTDAQRDALSRTYATVDTTPLLASRSPRCTCKAGPGEHPHTASGCDVEGCGCTWTPPADDRATARKANPHAHACATCSPDGIMPGPGCHNCRQTGMDQTPCRVCDAGPTAGPTATPTPGSPT